jgi:hypothetical protein
LPGFFRIKNTSAERWRTLLTTPDGPCVAFRFINVSKGISVGIVGPGMNAGTGFFSEWLAMTERFGTIGLEEYVVMPNHFTAIVEITEPVGATLVVARDVAHTNVPVSYAPQETTVHASKPGRPLCLILSHNFSENKGLSTLLTCST